MRAALAVAAWACITWSAGDIALGAIAAPAGFAAARAHAGELTVAPERIAGAMVGDAIVRWLAVAWVLAAISALALCIAAWRGRDRWLRVGAPIVAALLLIAHAAAWISARDVQQRAATSDRADPAFQAAHHRSETITEAGTLLALAVGITLLVIVVRWRPSASVAAHTS